MTYQTRRTKKMDLIKSLIPEITYLVGVVIVFITLWIIAGFVFSMFFLGGICMVVSAYLSNVMQA